MDAYDIAQKLQKYWMALYPKNSGDLTKSKKPVKVIVLTDEGYREVVGIRIDEEHIVLELDKE